MIIQTNKISPNFNDTEGMKNLGVSVSGATEGSISNVILEHTTDCAIQKETGSSVVYTEAQARQLNMGKAESFDDSLFSPSEFINSCMTGEDLKALSEEETPLEEYTSSQLERAVSRVKEQRSEKEQAVESHVEKEQEEQEALEQHLQEKLLQEKLPVIPENVARLSNVVSMLAGLDTFSQASMKFFIGNELKLTPEGIYAGSYGARGEMTPAPSAGDAFAQMENQIEEILAEGDVEVTEESMNTAKWLYENDVAVTAENVKTYQRLEELKEEDINTLISRIVDDMADGMIPEKADLTKLSAAEAGEAVKNLVSADDDTLRRAYPTEADFISAKRRMEEIRLSMTVEAARTMSAKGIDLDVSNLEKIVEDLREQERQARESLLMETGIPVTQGNAQVMADTVQAAKNVLSAPVELLGVTIEAGVSQTLGELSDSAVNLTAQYDKMEQSYEAVGTEVRRDLGDSITKAFRNVDDILEDLDLEITGRNQRAVRILAYNRMELSKENIFRMKEYDSKVTSLMESLKPPVVSEMIKRGINPLEKSVEELSGEIQDIQKEVVSEDISFRKFLWKMDHQGGLTSEERQSMIGVYRLLDKIEKSDGAVIGQVVKEGKELSLSSLLSAVRTRKAEGMDVRVENDFGGLQETVTSGTSISEQIQSAYGGVVVSELQKHLSPKALHDFADETDEMSLEALLEACRQAEEADAGMSDYYNQMAEQLKEVMQDPEGRIQAFLKELDLPDTMTNLMMAQAHLANGNKEYSSLWKKEESESLQEAFDNPEELERVYDEIDGNHTKALAESRESDDITYDGINAIAKMANSISFYRSLRTYRMYELPIITERGVTTCNVTIRDGEKQEKGTVEISMDSENLGSVQATFKVSGKRVRGFVTAENADSLAECRRILDKFEKDLGENGFTMDSESLIQGSRSSLHTGNKSDGTKNRDLYQVAKLFIENISGKDEEA